MDVPIQMMYWLQLMTHNQLLLSLMDQLILQNCVFLEVLNPLQHLVQIHMFGQTIHQLMLQGILLLQVPTR